MTLSIPKLSLVVLIGPSGSGKSTFAAKHFLPTEVLSSDACRGMVSDDTNDQNATNDAFEILHFVAAKRMALGRLTVVDATNVQSEARGPLVALARKYHCLPVAIVLNLPEAVCQERNRNRADRAFGPHVIRNQRMQLRRSLKGLKREGFRHIFELESIEDVEAAVIERVPLWNDRREERGPFDIIGDVHGCADELEALLGELGYARTAVPEAGPGWSNVGYAHPEGRKAVFVGDLVDRGPRVLDTLGIVRNMVAAGSALCVPGNHDAKLLKKLNGRDVRITHGLAETLAEIDAMPETVREPFTHELAKFLDGLVSHYVLDGGKLVVAHAGLKQSMQGRGSGTVRDFTLYGETTGETDEFGLPVRHNWAAEYRGPATVVYGHTPVPEPEWLNNTVNVDTGCVFGGRLTALRYPEREFVSVPAAKTYCEPARPFLPGGAQAPALTAQQSHDDLLDMEDVLGKRIVSTRLRGNVTIREAHATAAIEVISRFAVDPKWLIYLPPTMSPTETTAEPGLLEHPAEAFAYFGEPLFDPAQTGAIPLEDGGCVVVRHATPSQSLAWKVMWLESDMYPQGKDLYDTVLLAERYPLPRALLDLCLRWADVRPPTRTSAEFVLEWDVDWDTFLAEYPWVQGDRSDWLNRLAAAIGPTFLEDLTAVATSNATGFPSCWLTPDVVGLATAIRKDNAYDRLPILADALEEAGCDEVETLLHCRRNGPHSDGCRFVDQVLDTAK